MIYEVIKGVSLPFVGTLLGAMCVFFVKEKAENALEKSLCGFAAGIMTAASVFSLLIPSLEYSQEGKTLAFVPAVSGFMVGMLFVLALDVCIDTMIPKRSDKDNFILMAAVSIHNLPEGMAVGIVYAGIISGSSQMSFEFALALAFGIALQNFPEGAIVSMPLAANKMSRSRAFAFGVLSGVAELLGAIATLFFAGYVVSIMPYMLSFAAGAMMYVVAHELLPKSVKGGGSYLGVLFFAAGFCLMMAMDTALG